jgi:hypothetical protein
LDDVGITLNGWQRQVFDRGDLTFEVNADTGFALDTLDALDSASTSWTGNAWRTCRAHRTGGTSGAALANDA